MNIHNIPLDLIDEDTEQPRNNFNEDSLTELVNSIREVGLLNPIKVYRTNNDRYKIIFGNRRYKAYKILNLSKIPCIVSEKLSEKDIIIEQLTENIQREAFTPIEEAEAFQNLLNNSKFKISLKYLSSKLGKDEQYIKKKLDLLVFNNQVKGLVIRGNQITPNKLIEGQLLPLKDIDIEYRDPLALIVARDEVTISEVKKISTLFKDKTIKPDTKEKLLTLSGPELLNTWSVYEQEKNEKKKFTGPSGTINNNPNSTLMETYKITPIEELLQNLITQIPSHRKIPLDTIYTFEQIKIENKEHFLSGIDALIDNLEAHLIEWKKIRDLAKKSTIKIIK